MSGITTHVLDTASGKPAAGVWVTLSVRDQGSLRELARARTDSDGRVRDFELAEPLAQGNYRLTFEVAAYFESRGTAAFFEQITLEFAVRDARQHYHVPLLLSPFGYTTYRGS
jgi:5-hydroxyisourate hydrolase